eukprot:4428292-Pyramimonas_sp.AAC.1
MLAVVREAGQLRLIGQMTVREVHRLRTSDETSEGMQRPCDKVATAPTERHSSFGREVLFNYWWDSSGFLRPSAPWQPPLS